MSATTYEQPAPGRRPGTDARRVVAAIGEALLGWLGRDSGYERLNALADAQLARVDMKRSDLLERCHGWRAYY